MRFLQDNLGEDRFKIWFSETKLVKLSGNDLTISVPSHYFFEVYERQLYNVIRSGIHLCFGKATKLFYEVRIIESGEGSNVMIESPAQSPAIANKLNRAVQKEVNPLESDKLPTSDIDSQLNETLNFQNYCVGESNKLPFTIAEFIANNPTKTAFNPYFLYGDVGVGKTHLIQAIGIRLKENNPNALVLFLPMRQFQNLYVQAYKKGEIPGFINWFQQFDALLFDDLQELSNKHGTMDALFPIFNHLHQRGRQLIFTCDRPPVELDGISDRLIDRFKWGVTEKLSAPDLNLRKKILHLKASNNGLSIPDEILDYIAENTHGSVRELEGIVMGILTRSIALNQPISLEMTREVMKNSVVSRKKSINFDMIVDATAEYYKLNPDVIFSKSRVRDIADARMVIMYLANKLTSLSSKAIGRKLNRTHATVHHGIEAVRDRMPFASELYEAVECIQKELSH